MKNWIGIYTKWDNSREFLGIKIKKDHLPTTQFVIKPLSRNTSITIVQLYISEKMISENDKENALMSNFVD